MKKQRPYLFTLITAAGLSFFTGATYANTTVTLDQPVHFLTAEGSDVVLDAGSYTVEAVDKYLIITPSEGQAVDTLLLDAQTATHEETLTAPLALSAEGEKADTYHLALLLPDGKRLEAIGTFSGLRSRDTLSLLTLRRLKTLSLTQRTASTEYSTPTFGGGGGTQTYNLDCGNGAVLVGGVYKAGMWLDAIGIICQRVNSQTGALGDEFTRGPVGGSGGISHIARCNSGKVVHGVKGQSGQFVNGILLYCTDWDPSQKAPVHTTSNDCRDDRGGGGMSLSELPDSLRDPRCRTMGVTGGTSSDPFYCPQGKVGKAFRGKYGWYIDSARFVCDLWDK